MRPGHQAAAMAAKAARAAAVAISAQGTLSRSMRWSTADSSVGPTATQSARPAIVPHDRGDRPDDAAVGHEHEAEVLVRGADGGEHAELAQPPLRDDREARGGDQRGQEEEDGGHGEHRQRVRRAVVARRSSEPVKAEPSARDSLDERVDRRRRSRRPGPSTWSGAPGGRRGDERELVAQLARVLDDADDGPATAVEREGRPDLEPQELRDAVGDRDLAGARRVAAPARARAARRRRRRPDPARGSRPSRRCRGQRPYAVPDDLRSSRTDSSAGGERRLELSRIGAVEPEQVIGRAELGVVRGARVVDDRDAADRRGHRDREQRHHQDLLPPLAPEHAPGPADHGAAGGDAAVPRSARAPRR